MSRADALLRVSGVMVALAVTFASVAFGWAQTTRTTPTGSGALVVRENLWTGKVEYCAPASAGDGVSISCAEVNRVARPDFSDRASHSK